MLVARCVDVGTDDLEYATLVGLICAVCGSELVIDQVQSPIGDERSWLALIEPCTVCTGKEKRYES